MSPQLPPPGTHGGGWGTLTEVHEIGKCTAGGIPVLIGQLYFILILNSHKTIFSGAAQ